LFPQFKKMHLAIELAGGIPLLMEGKGDDSVLLGDYTVVMATPEVGMSQEVGGWVGHVKELLAR